MKKDICWLCGNEFTINNQKTMHHVIPQHLNPITNITIPLHRECHDECEKATKPMIFRGKNITQIENTITALQNILDFMRGENLK